MTEQQTPTTFTLKEGLDKWHNRPVYRNPKSGKFYTFEKDKSTGETKLFTVFVDNVVYNNHPVQEDRIGRAYKVISCKAKTTKNGFLVFTTGGIIQR